MMLIPCPYCGPRNETEFNYAGQAHIPYPHHPDDLTDKEWGEFLFYRDNPRGDFAERWHHHVGCRRWFNAIRNTITYEFKATFPVGQTWSELTTEEKAEANHD